MPMSGKNSKMKQIMNIRVLDSSAQNILHPNLFTTNTQLSSLPNSNRMKDDS